MNIIEITQILVDFKNCIIYHIQYYYYSKLINSIIDYVKKSHSLFFYIQ